MFSEWWNITAGEVLGTEIRDIKFQKLMHFYGKAINFRENFLLGIDEPYCVCVPLWLRNLWFIGV